MNASAYLKTHGWRGEGFSLDYSDRGLSKPLLVAYRHDHCGIGIQRHTVSSQWWLNAFEKKLKTFGTDSRTSSAITTTTQTTGLYGNFIKADTLESTIKYPSFLLDDMAEKSNASYERLNTAVPLAALPTMVHRDEQNHHPTDEAKKSNKKRKHSDDKGSEAKKKQKRKKSKKDPSHNVNEDHLRKPNENTPIITNPVNTHSIVKRDSSTYDAMTKSTKGDSTSFNEIDGMAVNKKHENGSTDKINELDGNDIQTINGPKRLRMKTQQRKIEEPVESAAASTGILETFNTGNSPNTRPETFQVVRPDSSHDPHPDSIAALMRSGIYVDMKTTNRLNSPVMNLPGTTIRSNSQELATQPGQEKKKKNPKSEKIAREKAKRVAKRESKHWAEVRANPHLYRPDGTLILDSGYSNPLAEIQHKHTVQKLEVAHQRAAKLAKKALKEQTKIERRVARKIKRSEKKRKNHMAMQAHISAKIKAQKIEKDTDAAKEKGMLLEAYQKMIEDKGAAANLKRDLAKAEELGITLQEHQRQRAEYLNQREIRKEAQELGLSYEVYANQDAVIDDTTVCLSDVEPGIRDGTYENFGRSPIDRIWAKQEVDDHKIRSSTSSKAPKSRSSTMKKNASGDDDSDTSDSNEDSESESEREATDINIADGIDFIPLHFDNSQDEKPSGSLPFMIDTTGDPNLPLKIPEPKKRVKDMTKEERKARLEAMKARRAERAAKSGVKKLTSKERRRKRTERKEQILSKMTLDILNKNKGETLEKVTRDSGNFDTPPVGHVVKDSIPAKDKPQKTMKEARREARRIMKGMKKGKVEPSEIMPGWQIIGKQKKRGALRGNGGREPKRSEPDV